MSLFLPLAFLSIAFPTCLSRSSGLVDDGNRLLIDGRLVEAIAYYSLALSLDSTCGEALLNRGIARELMGAYYEALEDYDKAFARGLLPTDAVVHRVRVRLSLYEQARDTSAARGIETFRTLEIASIEAMLERDIEFLIRQNSMAADGYTFRGRLRFLQGRYAEALEDYTSVLRIDPNDSWTLNQRGRCHFELGDNTSARKDFSRAIQQEESNGGYYYNRGLTFENEGRDSEAVMDFTESIKRDSSDAWAYFKRGMAKTRNGDTGGGSADLQKAALLGLTFDSVKHNR